MTEACGDLYHITREPSAAADGAPLLVLIHGYGSDERDLMGLAPYLDGRFRTLSVRAPLALEQGGYGWFPVEFSPLGLVVDYAEAAAAKHRLADTIATAQEQHGTAGDDTYLLGFSQGATMALSIGLQEPHNSAAVASLSGLCRAEMMPTEAETLDALGDKPFFVSHGLDDPLIPIAQGRSVNELLQPLCRSLNYREYSMGHEINQECLSDLAAWLAHRLDGD